MRVPVRPTPEWYLLPSEGRAGLLREHGEMGREFPDVLANTTSAFGINDWEIVLAPSRPTTSGASWTASGGYARRRPPVHQGGDPFVTGVRKDVPEALADLA